MEKEFWPLSQEKAAELRPPEKMAMAENYASARGLNLKRSKGKSGSTAGGSAAPTALLALRTARKQSDNWKTI